MNKIAEQLKDGDGIELVNGSISNVNHVFTDDRNAYILMDNYRWYVYGRLEVIKVV